MREDIQINSMDCDELKCAICMQLFYKPIKTSCGHNFCGKCITQWMQKKKQCPFCRKEFPNYNFYKKDEIMGQRVDKLEVSCLRCYNWSGQIIELKNHRLKQCTQIQINIQWNDFFNTQDDFEDSDQVIMNEILSIKKQQNYHQLLEAENDYFTQSSSQNKEPKITKKRKIEQKKDNTNNDSQDVIVLQAEDINALKNSKLNQQQIINNRFQLQKNFLHYLTESQYKTKTKQFFASLIYYRNQVVYNQLNSFSKQL